MAERGKSREIQASIDCRTGGKQCGSVIRKVSGGSTTFEVGGKFKE